MGWKAKGLAIACSLGLWLAPAIAQSGEGPRGDAALLAQWVLKSADHRGAPFAIVDKKAARIHVFLANGRPAGSSAILLGQAVGDDSAPNVGFHTAAGKVPLHERTTPAGRFVSEPGANLDGEHVVWVDYDSAFAIHRLRPGASRADREARLGSDSARDKRVSLGCVVVPEAFYRDVIMSALGRRSGVVYVLPETRSARELFDAL